MTKNQEYEKKAHLYIPAGAHTYSRTDEVFPVNAPKVFARTKGAYAWDVDGNQYLDYALACRSVTVGYDFERITNAAIIQLHNGNTASKASKVEVDAAEMLCNMFPWVDMVKFAKNGSVVTTAAVKLARAYTGRKYVARCREHSFFSYDDWFIGDTPADCGIPEESKCLTLDFSFNDPESIRTLFERYRGQVAALIMEPAEGEEPVNDFLKIAGELCKEYGVVYILDEMITGFRWDILGACKYYGAEPDLVTYGKGIANGFSVAVLGGRRDIMELGGLTPGQERVFLISTTHGAEMSSLGAMIETVKVYEELHVTDRLWSVGRALTEGLDAIATDLGIANRFHTTGAACSPNFVTLDRDGNVSLAYRTLFVQEMLKEGILMPYISTCYEHSDADISRTLEAAEKALTVYKNALNDGIEKYLEGRAIKPVFRKFN